MKYVINMYFILDQVYCGRRGSAIAAYRLPSRQFRGEPMGMQAANSQVCNWLQLAQGQTTLPFAKGYISCVVLRLQHSRRWRHTQYDSAIGEVGSSQDAIE